MAAGQIYKGRKLRISVNGKTIYHATECSLTIDSNTEDIATKDTDGNVVVPDGYNWSLNTNALVADKETASTQSDFMDVLDLQLQSTEVTIQFTTGETGDFLLSGKAYVTNASITASVGSAVSGSFTFTGNGNLTKSTVSE